MNKKMLFKQFLSLALTGLMLTTSIAAFAAEPKEDEMPGNPVYSDEGVTWDQYGNIVGDKLDHTDWSYVYFGSYPQSEVKDSAIKQKINAALKTDSKTTGDAVVDGVKYRKVAPANANTNSLWREDHSQPAENEYRYFKWEPIKWKVLQVDTENNRLFVVADKALDSQQYNERSDNPQTSVTWETCTMRKWLNGSPDYEGDPDRTGFTKNETFINTAFSGLQDAIIPTEIKNPDNPNVVDSGGAATTDSVFLLSFEDASKSNYGYCDKLDYLSTSRAVQPTAYGNAMGIYPEMQNGWHKGNCKWWLRSPGSNSSKAMICYYDGEGFIYGYDNINDQYGVVPALYLKIDSDLWSLWIKYSITFDGNGMTVADNIAKTDKDGKVKFPTASRDGYTLKGWFTEKEGGEQVTENTVFTKDMTVYAQWTKNESPSTGGEGGGTGTGTETETQKPGTEGGQQAPGKDPAQTEVATPGQVTLGSVKNNKKATVTIKIKTKKTDPKVDGYEVASATSKKKLSKVKKFKTFTKTSFKLTKMKKGKTYYIKVRAFNKGADGKIVYGEWSKVKKIKVKK